MKKKVLVWLNSKGIHYFISAVLVIIIAGALVTFFAYNSLQEQRIKKDQAHEAILKLNQITSLIMAGDVGTRGFMLIPEERFAYPLTYAENNFNALISDLSKQLHAQQYPGADSLKFIEEDIRGYISLLGTMKNHAENGDPEAARDILYKDKGNPLVTTFFIFRDKATKYEKTIIAEADQKAEDAFLIISLMQWLLLIVGLPTLSLVLYRIKSNEKSRKRLFSELEKSNSTYIFDPNSEEIENDEEKIIQNIIQNLKQASGFIKAVTNGDYSVKWEGIDAQNRAANKENIAGELIQMREQMKKVKENDQRRLWATEGLSKVAEITRKYQHDIQLLSDQLVINVVNYLNANQAGLFTVNEEKDADNPFLELVACYAYERKKYQKKQIEIGEGLLGQAYLEQDTIYMTDLPEEYITITSGLGKAVPDCILIVPLKYNEQVMGVLEIASFQTFEQYQISFVEELAEIIASSLSTVRTNARTKALLEQSQEQAEQMRSQEEEMRQNMEELQATQEEMERKTKEYQEIIQRYEEEATQKTEA